MEPRFQDAKTSDGVNVAPPAFLPRTPFIGRRSETARLHHRLEETRAGRGGLGTLVGEPGIGTARLAEEFAKRAGPDGTAAALVPPPRRRADPLRQALRVVAASARRLLPAACFFDPAERSGVSQRSSL